MRDLDNINISLENLKFITLSSKFFSENKSILLNIIITENQVKLINCTDRTSYNSQLALI